jgi:predicted GNAT family acetyltransferase
MEDLVVRYTSDVFYIRFEDGSKAYLEYKIDNDKMYLISTYTPPQHRGKGVAKKLVDKAVEVARERGLKIIPICSYSVYYFIKNKDLREILDEPYRKMSDKELERYYRERLEEERSKESIK